MPSNPVSLPPIIYQDRDILVIDKPAGLVVQKSYTHDQPTLEQVLPEKDSLERKGIVHRLDKDTSGLMVIAQTKEAQENLYAQFQQRNVYKEYTALVWGRFKDAHAVIDAPIARHPKYGHKYIVMADGRESKTEIWRQHIYRLNNEIVSLLKINLHTGRTHQARVHLHALGYPMVGDRVYGRRKDQTSIRQFLHAGKLAFDHPTSGDRVEFASPLPADLDTLLDKLKKETIYNASE